MIVRSRSCVPENKVPVLMVGDDENMIPGDMKKAKMSASATMEATKKKCKVPRFEEYWAVPAIRLLEGCDGAKADEYYNMLIATSVGLIPNLGRPGYAYTLDKAGLALVTARLRESPERADFLRRLGVPMPDQRVREVVLQLDEEIMRVPVSGRGGVVTGG